MIRYASVRPGRRASARAAEDDREAVAGLAVDGQTGLRDEALSGDGRFLYAIDADSRRVFGWSVGENGSLSAIGSWEGLPATVAGLAAS